MPLLYNNYYYISDYPKYNNRLMSFIEEHCYFSVGLVKSYSNFRIPKRKRNRIYRDVLDKLIPLGTDFFVYDLNTNSAPVKQLSTYLLKDHSRYKIIIGDDGWKTFDSLLYRSGFSGSVSDVRGGVIGKCKIDTEILRSIFDHCYNPIVVGNAGVSCGKNALDLAKRSQENGMFHGIIDKLNTGLQSITLVSNNKDIMRIFDLASHSCTLSSNYRNFQIEIYDEIDEIRGTEC